MLVWLSLAGLLLVSPAAVAQDAVGQGTSELALDANIIQASVQALTVLLVLSVLIESGLETIFDWRVYRAYFARRALKPPIAVVVSWIIVRTFELDVFASLLDSFREGDAVDSIWVTELLTALILAGGSGTVNKILSALNVRTPAEPEPRVPPQKAWISVQVERGQNIVGPVRVTVTEDQTAPATLPSIAGSTYTGPPSLASLLLPNRGRFPPNGGYEVESGKAYRVTCIACDESGASLAKTVTPEPVKLASGAWIDFDVTIGEPKRRRR